MDKLTTANIWLFWLGYASGVFVLAVILMIRATRDNGKFQFKRKGCSTCKYKTNSLSKGPCCFCNRNKSIDVLINLSKISTAPLIKYTADNWEKNNGKT